MQILEATISLMVLISFLSFIAADQTTQVIDNSLYKFQLVNDAWRVLYLRGDFKEFSFDSGNMARDKAEDDLKQIGKLTNFCILIGGERVTNCRGEKIEKVASSERIVLVDEKPQTVMVTIANRDSKNKN